MPDFTSFNEFVDRTASAKVEHHRETIAAGLQQPAAALTGMVPVAIGTTNDDRIEAEFAKMKAYVLNLYKDITNVTIQHTFLGRGGDFLDCIPFEQQPAYREAKKPGMNMFPRAPQASQPQYEPRANASDFGPQVGHVLPPLHRGLLDSFGKPMVCPEDRVALRRVSIAQMAQYGKFENFFRKYAAQGRLNGGNNAPPPQAATPPPPFAVGGSGEVHRHALCSESSGNSYFACSHFLNTWNVDPSPGVFNLSQLWMFGTNGQGQLQTIESGWQNYLQQGPALFVYYNPDDYGSNAGYGVKFVVKPGSPWYLGAEMPGPFSAPNGDQYGIQMQWEIDDQGFWLLYIQNDLFGWFLPGAYDGTLAQSASGIQFGGEVSSEAPNSPGSRYPSTGKMGSGLKPFSTPSDSYMEVAFQSQITVKMAKGGAMTQANLQVPTFDPRDANYLAVAGVSSKPNWGSYFFFGGPNG
jgi:hypothetical protein